MSGKDGGSTAGRKRGWQRGLYLIADSPTTARPLAVEDGSGDKNLLAEAAAENLALEELDDLINELIRESNRRYEAQDHEPARLGELAELHGQACADCGRNAPVFGPLNFDGERHDPGDYCCRTCAVNRGAVERRERCRETGSEKNEELVTDGGVPVDDHGRWALVWPMVILVIYTLIWLVWALSSGRGFA